ncbi:MAG: hypothetical protein K0S68_34 [Candidatus Saccharibacteria bacterium]|jgi:antitoxin component YwqK of YwqJK toxin-antitoxin module|nr:hypothetical protein [Candidatus Saccharibacteria bacterium]
MSEQLHKVLHRNGSLRAQGPVIAGEPDGYWEWFRLDGTRMRSGYFEMGKPVGEWVTYDRQGRLVKTTQR